MKVLIFEDNLMWNQRLRKTLESLGHEAMIFTSMPDEVGEADVAIVNLGSSTMPPEALVSKLKVAGIRIVAHAGHKEKDLQKLGKALGCDRLATNSELTFKLEDILAAV